MSPDLRPVFPEEICMLELADSSISWESAKAIWAHNGIYYIDGKAQRINIMTLKQYTPEQIRKYIREHKGKKYSIFNEHVRQFVKLNQERLDQNESEAIRFIRSVMKDYPHLPMNCSFSGGKDSTCVSDLVVKATGDSSIPHIFGDTTLEYPTSHDYIKRFRTHHPNLIFRIARNEEQDFYKLCKEIGPPSRHMRWCCTTFKAGPVSRVLNSMYENREFITFTGLRRSESAARSEYEQIQTDRKTRKIQNQMSVCPIIDWIDADVWLYLFGENVDFNDAYRFGEKRVGCYCCPNSNDRTDLITSIIMPEQMDDWKKLIIDFARESGKRNPEYYFHSGDWRHRKGGYGLEAAKDVRIQSIGCTTEERAQIYQLNKPITEEFYELFIPFGIVSKSLGRKLLDEVIVLKSSNMTPILSLQPFQTSEYNYAVKIKMLNAVNPKELRKRIEYQIRKYNACRRCLKCEAVCPHGAIKMDAQHYHIDDTVCRRCGLCLDNRYLSSGCVMKRYLNAKASQEVEDEVQQID